MLRVSYDCSVSWGGYIIIFIAGVAVGSETQKWAQRQNEEYRAERMKEARAYTELCKDAILYMETVKEDPNAQAFCANIIPARNPQRSE